MPVTVSWDDETQTIVRVCFEGKFDFDDIFRAWEQELALVSSVDHPVYSINMFNHVPLSVKGLSVRRLNEFSANVEQNNLQMTVQVAENALARQFLKTLKLPVPHILVVVGTLDEAYMLIDAHRHPV